MKTDFDQTWEQLSEEILTGMKEWRLQHPRATLREIEAALDERLTRMRARMLQDMALASAAADWTDEQEQAKPKCPICGEVLTSRGKGKRKLQTQGGREIELERGYGVCPKCGTGFSPSG